MHGECVENNIVVAFCVHPICERCFVPQHDNRIVLRIVTQEGKTFL